jgi:uncharacterized protein YbcI
MEVSFERRRSDAEQISTEIVKVFKDYVGRGPTNARTYITQDVVTCLLSDTLTKAEHSLVESDNGEEVRSIRRKFQGTMREDLVAIVEKQLQRKVIAFMSDHSLDPDMACETFVLGGME